MESYGILENSIFHLIRLSVNIVYSCDSPKGINLLSELRLKLTQLTRLKLTQFSTLTVLLWSSRRNNTTFYSPLHLIFFSTAESSAFLNQIRHTDSVLTHTFWDYSLVSYPSKQLLTRWFYKQQLIFLSMQIFGRLFFSKIVHGL